MASLIGFALLAVASGGAGTDALFDPVTGYRVTRYRAVVDRVLEGVTRVDAAAAARLQHRAVLVDVTPAEGAVRDTAGKWQLAVPHATIPNAHWFPEAGRAVPPAGIENWFDRGVRRLTRGDRTRPILVFCLADCWMSWNAAIRLRRLGYTHLYWFADGIDGWREAGRRVVRASPEPPL